MEEKNFIDRNPVLHYLYHESILAGFLHSLKQFGIYCKYKYQALLEYLVTIPRRLGYNDPRFSQLKQLKNKYEGKRCFITCTGPSLTIEDLESLKDEYVFGMNSIALIHDKTDWVPDFLGVQDIHVFNKIKETLLTTNNGLVFAPYSYYKRFNTPQDWCYFPMQGAYHLYEMIYGPKYFAHFSDDCYKSIYDGYSITYTILQLAVYMGFREIYLIGADCSYLGKNQHFIETGHYDPGYLVAGDRMLASYAVAKEYAEKHNIKIFNATRGGCLELFKRVNLDEVLVRVEKNKISE